LGGVFRVASCEFFNPKPVIQNLQLEGSKLKAEGCELKTLCSVVNLSISKKDDLVKSQNWDGTVKSSSCKARKS
jgi:hypothetical protein